MRSTLQSSGRVSKATQTTPSFTPRQLVFDLQLPGIYNEDDQVFIKSEFTNSDITSSLSVLPQLRPKSPGHASRAIANPLQSQAIPDDIEDFVKSESSGETLDDTSLEATQQQHHLRHDVLSQTREMSNALEQIIIPDYIKGLLVDDWENVTRSHQLIPLPHPHPVQEITNDYLAHERLERVPGSASETVLEETVRGLLSYFHITLGRLLLYNFERPQYADMHALWTSGSDPNRTCPMDTYGAEHFCRLLSKLPELLAQTNMDQQAVTRLKEELFKFQNWFTRNATKYLAREYVTPPNSYHERARV